MNGINGQNDLGHVLKFKILNRISCRQVAAPPSWPQKGDLVAATPTAAHHDYAWDLGRKKKCWTTISSRFVNLTRVIWILFDIFQENLDFDLSILYVQHWAIKSLQSFESVSGTIGVSVDMPILTIACIIFFKNDLHLFFQRENDFWDKFWSKIIILVRNLKTEKQVQRFGCRKFAKGGEPWPSR